MEERRVQSFCSFQPNVCVLHTSVKGTTIATSGYN